MKFIFLKVCPDKGQILHVVIAKRLEKVDVLQIWGVPALNVRMGPLVADLLAKIKVDVLQILRCLCRSATRSLQGIERGLPKFAAH